MLVDVCTVTVHVGCHVLGGFGESSVTTMVVTQPTSDSLVAAKLGAIGFGTGFAVVTPKSAVSSAGDRNWYLCIVSALVKLRMDGPCLLYNG